MLGAYARRAPSPHNTQPTWLRMINDRHAGLEYVVARGLPVGDPQGSFTHVTIGIVLEILSIAAHAHGFELLADVAHPELILRRRINRLPYDDRPALCVSMV